MTQKELQDIAFSADLVSRESNDDISLEIYGIIMSNIIFTEDMQAMIDYNGMIKNLKKYFLRPELLDSENRIKFLEQEIRECNKKHNDSIQF